MSATTNSESLVGQGEFHSRKPGAEPLTTTGHKPGVKVGNDAVPEFHMEKHTPGTAPREHTFEPRPEGETPAEDPNVETQRLTDPSDTLGGATSQSVHTGLGKPVQGQTSVEQHGAHAGHRKKERSGLEGVGATVGDNVDDSARQKGADLPGDVEKGTKGKASAEYPSATERIPANAEEVAAEHKVPDRAYDYTQSGKPK
ncbi:hypothetical protein GGR52DRAFT_431946 [Hypoxylon sp. FL1284]|nr:hypothetical protein GGR52DRAFT_431946 [Hypoxylon sp. FL1284]